MNTTENAHDETYVQYECDPPVSRQIGAWKRDHRNATGKTTDKRNHRARLPTHGPPEQHTQVSQNTGDEKQARHSAHGEADTITEAHTSPSCSFAISRPVCVERVEHILTNPAAISYMPI